MQHLIWLPLVNLLISFTDKKLQTEAGNTKRNKVGRPRKVYFLNVAKLVFSSVLYGTFKSFITELKLIPSGSLFKL